MARPTDPENPPSATPHPHRIRVSWLTTQEDDGDANEPQVQHYELPEADEQVINNIRKMNSDFTVLHKENCKLKLLVEELKAKCQELESSNAQALSDADAVNAEVEQRLRQRIETLREERDEYIRNSMGRGASPALSTSTVPKSEKIPDPEQFDDGKTGPKFESWMIAMKNKLRVNADRYPSEDAKIAYVLTRVKGLAHDVMYSRVCDEAVNPYRTIDDVYKHLTISFADPNRKEEARREFKLLHMKTSQTFREFVAKFNILAQEAGISETDMKCDLFHALTARMQQAVMTYKAQDEGYATFVNHCHNVADTLRAVDAKFQKERSERAPKNAFSGGSVGKLTSKSSAAGNEDATKPALPSWTSLTPEERIRCRLEGRCYYCREKGHLTKDCPKAKARQQTTALKILERPQETKLDAGKEDDEGKENA